MINSLSNGNGFIYLWHTGVAQLVEHWSPKPGVGRSSRSSRAKYKDYEMKIITYFKESYNELVHKVTWPSWKELTGQCNSGYGCIPYYCSCCCFDGFSF